MSGGRPTKYNKAILEKANEYLADSELFNDVVPSISGLSIVLEVTRETLNQWSKDDDKGEFSDTLSKIKQKQETILLNKGLIGEFNATIAKLMLANHGYSDKQDTTLTGKDGVPLIPDCVKIKYD